MPRKGGNRAAQEAGSMRSAKQEGGSTGGRCAAASSSKGPRKQPVGRPKNKPSAEPLVRPRSSRRRMPARQPACSGDPLSCPLSFVLSSLTSLFMQQAEQGSRTLRFSMQCLLLEKRAGEQVEQEFVFLNTLFLSKETYGGGHMRGSNQSRSTK